MNHADLITAIAEIRHVTKADSGRTVEAVVQTIIDALRTGDEVRITGLGIFDAVTRLARSGRNPQTGETIEIPRSVAARFRAGKTVKDALNPPVQAAAKGKIKTKSAA